MDLRSRGSRGMREIGLDAWVEPLVIPYVMYTAPILY